MPKTERLCAVQTTKTQVQSTVLQRHARWAHFQMTKATLTIITVTQQTPILRLGNDLKPMGLSPVVDKSLAKLIIPELLPRQ